MSFIEYDRRAALEYVRKWARSRNPEYYDFSDIGGDCTNFASQCVFAGCGVMNFSPELGWYYLSLDDRSPSWTGASPFYDFMTSNTGRGPFGEQTELDELTPGDIIELANERGVYYHTLVLTAVRRTLFSRQYYVSAHTRDAYRISLSEYNYATLRCIHIIGARSD